MGRNHSTKEKNMNSTNTLGDWYKIAETRLLNDEELAQAIRLGISEEEAESARNQGLLLTNTEELVKVAVELATLASTRLKLIKALSVSMNDFLAEFAKMEYGAEL